MTAETGHIHPRHKLQRKVWNSRMAVEGDPATNCPLCYIRLLRRLSGDSGQKTRPIFQWRMGRRHRLMAQAMPRTAHSSTIHRRQTGRAKTTQIGAMFDPAATPRAATATAKAITPADNRAAFRQRPCIFQWARIWRPSQTHPAIIK